MESRYLNRFQTIKEKTGEQIRNRDAAGNLTERITHAKGSIEAQKQNTRDLFSTAQEMIAGINTHQGMIGKEMVKNMSLPTDKIKASPSSQLGYVQLTMRFLQAGVLHFMEQTYNCQQRISELEADIARLASYDTEIDILGHMVTLDIDTLEAETSGLPPSPPRSVTDEKPRSQTPQTPTSQEKGKKPSRVDTLKNKLPNGSK